LGGVSLETWLVFGAIVAAAIFADLLLFRPKTDGVSLARAMTETAAWIALALLFGIWILVSRGRQAGVEYFTAYVLEKSLSADNVLLFLVIFRAFGIGPRAQHRVLFSGIVGALVLRLAFVVAGIALLKHFHAVLYLFGAFLCAVGIAMLIPRRSAPHPERNWMVQFVGKVLPVSHSPDEERFLVRGETGWSATPLLLALVAIEATDVVFAADSVPAVLAITRDAFIAYSSNVFAILGLRAMYFGLAEVMARMRFLHQGLAVILLFVGGKMLASERITLSAGASLGVIVTILAIVGVASWLAPGNTNARPD